MTQFSPTALEEAAKAIYETWARNRSIDETWFGVCHVQHSIANEARQEATAAITAYLAQREKEGFVEVPLNLARRVTSIARRNEDAPEIHELSTLLTAAQNGGEPCK